MDNKKIMSVELGEVKKQVDDLDGSYNHLAKQLRELRKEWKSTNDESQRNEIGKQMVEINNQLKEMDASVGVFSRNVGNYTNSIIAAFDKVGLGTGNLGKVMNGAFSMASTGANSFKDTLTLIAKHPIIFAITAIVAVFMKLKDAISQNEVLSNKMKVAMSALEPIFNAITNAVDFLASKLVDLISWTMGKIPDVIRFTSKVTDAVGTGVSAIVSAVTFLPSIFNKVFKTISEVVLKGLGTMGEGIAKFLSAVGADGMASKLTSSISSLTNIVNKGFEVSGKILDQASVKVKGFFTEAAKGGEALAAAMEKSQKMRKNAIDLEVKMREEQALTAESELKQSKLREQIAQTSDPAERIKYQKQLRAEMEATGKRQVELARAQYEQAKYYASLAPNSKADNEQLAQLEANVLKTEASYTNMMASVDKQMTRNEKALTSTAKAEQAQRLKDLDEYVKSANESISQIGSEATAKLNKLNSDKELLASNGQLTPEQQQYFENERYKIISDSIQKQKDKYNELFESGKLTADKELVLRSKYNALLYQEQIESNNHQKALNEIWLNDRKKAYEQDVQNRKNAETSNTVKSSVEYSVEYVTTSDQYLNGEITYEQYQQRLSELQDTYSLQRLQAQVDADNLQLEELQRYYNDVVEKMGASSDAALEIEQKLTDARAKQEQSAAKLAMETSKKEVNDKKKATDQKTKYQDKELNAYKSFSSGMQALMGENSKAAKALAISDAIVNTWQGAAAVLKEGPAAYGGGIIGTVLMYANMAGVIGTGLANVKNIISEKQDSGSAGTSSVSGGALSQLNVNPLINEANDTLNLQNSMERSQTEQKVYILESDIDASNTRVKTRETESTF